MPQFTVHLISTISTAITVEAEDADAAIDLAYNSPRMPGSMGHGSFGNASVDESGDWQPSAVTDERGLTVWEEVADLYVKPHNTSD